MRIRVGPIEGGLVAAFADGDSAVLVGTSFSHTSISWPGSDRVRLLDNATLAAAPTGAGDIALLTIDLTHSAATAHLVTLSGADLHVSSDRDTRVGFGYGTSVSSRSLLTTRDGVVLHLSWESSRRAHAKLLRLVGHELAGTVDLPTRAGDQSMICGGTTVYVYGRPARDVITRVDLATGRVSRAPAQLQPPVGAYLDGLGGL